MSIAQNFPALKPSLLLDFANVKQLDPRITYSRASTGTFYDGKTVAKAEENLLVQSQSLNTIWGATGCSVIANTDTAPDGTTTADSVKEDGTTAFRRITSNQFGLAASTVYTLSVFVKQKTGSRFATIGFNSDGSNWVSATFDLSAGTNTQTLNFGYTSVSATITASINSWYRVTLTATTNAASVTTGLVVLGMSATSTFTQASRGFDSYAGDNTSEILYWQAQLEQRSTATAPVVTTTQPITNYIPVLQTAAANVARFRHSPITGESEGFWVEEQRANLVTYSEQFDNAAWSKTRSSITANTIVAPDGTLTGDKLVEDTTASSTHFIRQFPTISVAYAFSVFAKAAERTFFSLDMFDATNGSRIAVFNLSTGAVHSVTSGATAAITPVGNGWYRCVINIANSANSDAKIAILDGSAQGAYTGNGYSGIYIWGAQLEAGAFPTSYIKTEASQVTRSADSASMTGTNFSSWFNAGEGALYIEGFTANAIAGQNRAGFSITDGTTSNHINVRLANTATNTTINISGNALVSNSPYSATVRKFAVGYKVNDFAAVREGVVSTTSAAGVVPLNFDRLVFGNYPTTTSGECLNGTIKKLAFYPKRLTNTELQALTGV